MRLTNVAADARPQVRTLLIAAALTIALWFIPFAEVLTYPFRLFVTFIHEGGHVLAALLTFSHVQSLSVSMDGSGLVYASPSSWVSLLLFSSAGYVGAAAFGALLLILIRRAVAARWVLMGSAAFIFILTVVFGLLKPTWNGSELSKVPFTVIAGAAISLALVAVARYASARVATFFVSFLAVQCILNALLDLKTVFFLSTPLAHNIHTDAKNMSDATYIPQMFWVIAWIGLSVLILSVALRAYSNNCKRKENQQDLPFEEPLGV
ncbi:MAG TPA: M50 family metallopeptidase [Pyrinomonadaceae bacterium]